MKAPGKAPKTSEPKRKRSKVADTKLLEQHRKVQIEAAELAMTGIFTAAIESSDDLDQNWRDYALCAQTDPEAFFPEKGGSTREAKRVCASCEVRTECLDYALTNAERFGIWGGLSERERRRLQNSAL